MSGGDRAFETTGSSMRYGINVTHQQHSAHLALAGLQPETDGQGGYIGYDSTKIEPLQDPEHAFNSFYKAGADAVFSKTRGRLL